MDNTITLSKEELKNMIDEEVQKALERSKPVRDQRMRESELRFRNTVESEKLDMNWHSVWISVRMTAALKMGYRAVSKVPQNKYSELLENLEKELDEIIAIFKEEKNGVTNF